MTNLTRIAALAAVLLLGLAAPAAAQSAALAAPAWDARLTPTPAAAAAPARVSSAAISRPVRGAALVLVGAATMWATKKMEGENGEDGVPFLPLISGTMGALSFWYGVYEIVDGR